jgi:hypothetical protein
MFEGSRDAVRPSAALVFEDIHALVSRLSKLGWRYARGFLHYPAIVIVSIFRSH